MTPPTIPLVRTHGGHLEAGRQIGDATAAAIGRLVAETNVDPALVERYRAVTFEHIPWVVDELDGAAAGAGVDPLAIFAASIEELAPAEAPTGCSDLVVTGVRTAAGHLLVAHTNDLYVERPAREQVAHLQEPWDADTLVVRRDLVARHR